MKRVVWVSSWDRVCGIADYSKVLFQALKQDASGIELILLSLDEFRDAKSVVAQVARLAPDLVHFQHEYGFYGGKNPPSYWFPKAISEIRAALPRTKLIATAHTVLSPEYRFPVSGKGFQAPIRWAANLFLLSALRRLWAEKTWGALDAVVVHSRLQIPVIREAKVALVEEIPLYVPRTTGSRWRPQQNQKVTTILVFGFISPEKGQDIAVDAIARMGDKFKLVIAGGVRRGVDETYHSAVRESIARLGVGDRVEITGFVPSEKVSEFYESADLVLAPFRETSGSASLVQAFSRGAPVLASDLPLNRDIADRVPGALAFFKTEDASDCARQIQKLLADSEARFRLSQAAFDYAIRYSPERIAEAHRELYDKVLSR